MATYQLGTNWSIGRYWRSAGKKCANWPIRLIGKWGTTELIANTIFQHNQIPSQLLNPDLYLLYFY
jgi:hypothetical protein